MEKLAGRSVLGEGNRRAVRRRSHPTLVGTLVRAGRVREAIGVGEGSLTRGAATREECEDLARAYWSLGMGRSAERLSRGLAQQQPPSLESLVLLGEIYAERMWAGQLHAVVRRLARLAPRHPKLTELTRVMETLGVEDEPPSGDDVSARVARAEWCLKRGWIGEAEGLLRKVLVESPRNNRAQELLWGCHRERRLEARFGPLSPVGGEPEETTAGLTVQEVPAEVVAAQPTQASAEGDDFHIDPARLSEMMEPAPVVEAVAAEAMDADEEDDDEDEEDWEDDDEDDEEDDEDIDTFSPFQITGRLSLTTAAAGPSPLRERLRDQVVVIERGDRPRMADQDNLEPKGTWYRSTRELQHQESDGPVSLLGMRGPLALAPEPVTPAREPKLGELPKRSPPPPSAGRDSASLSPKKASEFLRVGRYGFDDDEEGAATEVGLSGAAVPRPPTALGRVGAPPVADDQGDQWDEGPTRAVVEEVVLNAFVDEEDDRSTRQLGPKAAEPDHWEKEVETRVAGLDVLDRAKAANASEPTRALNRAEPTTAPAPPPGEATVALPVDTEATTALPDVPAARPAERGPTPPPPRPRPFPGGRRSEPVLPVPEAPSMLSSPALLVAVGLFVALAVGFYHFQSSRRQERLDALSAQVESLLLKGDVPSIQAAGDAVEAARADEPNPLFDALAARVAWARWSEVGGATLMAPDQSVLNTLRDALQADRDVIIAQAHRDLFTRDLARGALRLEEGLQAYPNDPLLMSLLARLRAGAGVQEQAYAVALVVKASEALAGVDLPAGTTDQGMRPLLEAQVALAGVEVALAQQDLASAGKRLKEAAFLNPSQPWIPVYSALLALPPETPPADAQKLLAQAQEALPPQTPPRPRAWLYARQMDLALKAGDLAAAAALADRVMTADPSWPEGLYRSALAQAWRGDQQIAMQRAQQAGLLAPFDPVLLEARVVLLLDAQEIGAAEVLLADLPPDLDVRAEVARARAEVALGRRDPAAAEKWLTKAVEKAPQEPRTLLLQSRVGALLEGRRRGRPPLEALLTTPELLALDLSHARVQARLANLSTGTEARNLAKEATRAAPRDPVVREILAEGYEARGDTGAAIQALEDALKIAPSRLRTQLMLARLLALSGNKAGATRYWEPARDRCHEGPLCSEVATLMSSSLAPPRAP